MISPTSAFSARFVALLLAVAFAVGPTFGCASSTNITSEPSGAQVRIDGSPIGETPVVYFDDQVWLWTKHTVTLDKPGYNQTTGRMAAQINAPLLIVGILCFWPLALVGEYRPNYHYMLTQKQAADLMIDLHETAGIDFAQ